MATIKNLIAINGSERIVWNPDKGHLEVSEGDKPKQNLLLASRPYFTVKDIKLSPVKNLLALVGDNGVTIVEIPRKLSRCYKGEIQESQTYCKTFNINERLFTCEKRLKTTHVVWHPFGYEAKQVLCILTNDNRLRFHNVSENQQVQVIDLRLQNRTDDKENDTLCLGISMLNLNESAICFDFGPSVVIQEPDILWPIYILMGSGDIYLIYTNAQNPLYAEYIIGPLTMLPQAEDNYGSDACSLIVLDSSPPLLAIANPTGTIYHCFAYPDREAVLSKQTLYVYEAIELSRDLIANPEETYSLHQMRLLKDPTSDKRYFCVHQNGVHTIVVPILEEMQRDSEMICEKESFSEFLICTRTSTPGDGGFLEQEADSRSTPVGLAVEVGKTGISLLVLMPANELIVQRISPATTLINRKRFPRKALDTSRDMSGDPEILNLSQVDASRANFDEQIQQILRRKTSVPMLKLADSDDQKHISEVFRRSISIFKSEYLAKFELAGDAIMKKLSILEQDMQNQRDECDRITREKDYVYNSVISLASKADMVCSKQKDLLTRLDKVLAVVSYGHPDLSEAEAKLRRELASINGKLLSYRDQLDSVVNKHKYHLNQKDPAYSANSDLILSQTQLNGIKEILARQGSEIADLKRAIKVQESRKQQQQQQQQPQQPQQPQQQQHQQQQQQQQKQQLQHE